MERLKPERIAGVKLSGIVTENEKNKWFSFDFRTKNRDFRKELKEIRPRFQKIENGDYRYFRDPVRGSSIDLLYLNWESAKGLYKNPENNLPYEVLDKSGSLVYRQSIVERKEEIFNRLEKSAIEEGLKK